MSLSRHEIEDWGFGDDEAIRTEERPAPEPEGDPRGDGDHERPAHVESERPRATPSRGGTWWLFLLVLLQLSWMAVLAVLTWWWIFS